MAKTGPIVIAARRAKVAELILQRIPYRTIAEQFGVTHSTITGDVAALRKEWAKSYGKTDEMFDQAVIDMDALQVKAIEVLESSTGPDRLAAIDRVLKIADQRNKLLNLYPRPGGLSDEGIPLGPIQVQLQVVPAGNRDLIRYDTDSEELEPENDYDH